MTKSKFQTLVESYEPVEYRKVKRDKSAYDQTTASISRELERLIDEYKQFNEMNQTARLTRDRIDDALRRAHGYNIAGNIKAHYREKGVNNKDYDFEHVIPQKVIRDMLIQGKLTIMQAMNPPTCLINKANHVALKKAGWASKTPNVYHFFDRYTNVFAATFETYNGQVITDLHGWTLEKHYQYFGIPV
jgi:hypothetical protein